MAYLELQSVKRRLHGFLPRISARRVKARKEANEVFIAPCGYKESNTPPPKKDFVPYEQDSVWAKTREKHCWFRVKFNVPKEWGKDNLYLNIKPERGTACLTTQYTAIKGGTAIQGLDGNHTRVKVESSDKELYLYAYSGCPIDHIVSFACELQLIDPEVEGLYYDLKILENVLKFADEESLLVSQAKEAVNGVINRLDTRDFESPDFSKTVSEARKYLKENFYAKQTPIDEAVYNIGHTHIDVAWLWPMRQTREKAQRSFATVIALMEKYPEYKFMSSQPALYYFVQQDDPKLFEKIKQRVKEGRWDIEGGTWLEMDCNLTSGESLCRQLIFGQRYFEENFGRRTRSLWLPDVFGYAAALPQILMLSGVDTFVTSKISWNETNRMPWDIFEWQGIDGTRILSYFITSQDTEKGKPASRYTTYTGDTLPSWQFGTYRRFVPKEACDAVLNTYGHGDGGGGPTAEMIEYVARQKDGLTTLPKARFATATETLEKIHKKARSVELPVWRGELYLEFHRGTYTSVSGVKKGNRRAEFNLQTVENMGVLANSFGLAKFSQKELADIWRCVLTNQFHDILPGSSINLVYDVTLKELADCNAALLDKKRSFAKLIAGKVKANDKGLAVFNPHGAKLTANVKTSGGSALVKDIPAHGWKVVPEAEVISKNTISASKTSLENGKVKLSFDKYGRISSFVAKEAKRELVEKGQAFNTLKFYEDIPEVYDNWEIKDYATEKGWDLGKPIETSIIEDGSRKGVRFVFAFGKSKLVQTVFLTEGSARVDFETEVDWQENEKVLKAEFPTNLISDYATYDIQFGSARRPTHRNTSWDQAKFEVCANKYMDLSEPDFGLSLLNDCKYGHSCLGGKMAITLLKSSNDPDPDCNRGQNSFTYSLLPHAGGAENPEILKEAYALNEPLFAVPVKKQGGSLPAEYSFITSSTPSVIAETVKASENGKGAVIRLLETKGTHTEATLTFGTAPKSVTLTNILEDKLSEIPVKNGGIKLTFHPFEIKTIRLTF